ncbi:fatty acid cis/trans isomerase [Klebsiella pneumoniae]|uniref:fatty acid cis/trans isomerase n=1 Tax=Klebsiella pneumoniae TaxID=573 RepID=UPI00351F5DC4
MLTIFRHFDSASVTKGLIGEVPQTMWLFDYPQRVLYRRSKSPPIQGLNVPMP